MSYKVQIDDIVREATADEIIAIEAAHAAAAAEQAKVEAAASARASAIAKLGALGLSDTEIKALVG